MLNLYQKFNHRRTSACRVQDPVNGHTGPLSILMNEAIRGLYEGR